MRIQMLKPLFPSLLTLLLSGGSLSALAHNSDDGDDPIVDQSKTSQALKSLPRKPLSERAAVTIYQFRSSSSMVTPLAATDMFTTGLIDSGQFRVVERAQLQQTVIREKQMNGSGQSTGSSAQKQLRGAQYIFEGSVSEANAGEKQNQGGISVAGLNLGGNKNKDSIAVDIRILDADTGDVLDSIAMRKAIKSSGVNVATSGLLNTVASVFGKAPSPVAPDVSYQSARQEGVDKALRACIDASILELIKRLPAATAQNGGG